MLTRVETAAATVGLMANAKKTKVMAFNQQREVNLKTGDDTTLEVVEEFTYLGSLVSSSTADIKKRIALTWTACNSLRKIWRSSLSNNFKLRLFCSTVESVLLYGCEAWTLTKQLSSKLDGCYTRLLRSALAVNWQDHVPNKDLYGTLEKVTDKIRHRRMKLAGHCFRHPEEVASSLVLWTPAHGKRSRGRPSRNFVQQLEEDTGLDACEIGAVMTNREEWRRHTGRGLAPRPR